MGAGRLPSSPRKLVLALAVAALAVAGSTSVARPGGDLQGLVKMRQDGDLAAQRRHVWNVFARVTAGEAPAFEAWQGEAATFAGQAEARTGVRGFRRPAAGRSPPSFGAPVVAYSLYNPAAFDHIRSNRLYSAPALQRLRSDGRVPDFPASAVVIKTAWWPVAGEGVTALPVWDPELNPPEPSGNPYIGWRRVVGVDPSSDGGGVTDVAFMGQRFARVTRVGLESFHHVRIDAPMAAALAGDPESARTAWMALGRQVRPGDHLLLVGLNLMTREMEDWVWGAFWWHDVPDAGPFAAGRPGAIQGPWRNYLMQAAFDEAAPKAADGGAHVCFNPWLEGRFPDGGQGGGTASNCMSCHERASYPALPFLPVKRGPVDRAKDPALAKGQVETSFLWSLAMHAQSSKAPTSSAAAGSRPTP